MAVGHKSVHRSTKTVLQSCSGAFVYTVLPLQTDVGAKECTQIDEDSFSAPFRGIHVRCYNASYNVNSDAGCDANYSVNCDASCDVNYVGWYEYLSRYRVSVALLQWLLFLGRENRFYAIGSMRQVLCKQRYRYAGVLTSVTSKNSE